MVTAFLGRRAARVLGHTLRSRLLALLLAVGLLPTIAIGAFLLVADRAAALTEISEALDLRAREGTAIIERSVAEARGTIIALAENPVVQDPSASEGAMLAQLSTARRLNPDFMSLAIVMRAGPFVTEAPPELAAEWAEQPWLRDRLPGPAFMSEPYLAGRPPRAFVDFGAPVRSSDGTSHAFVVGRVALDALARPLRAVHVVGSAAEEHGGLSLLDAHGVWLAGAPPGSNPLTQAPPAILAPKSDARSAFGALWASREVPGMEWYVASQVERAVIDAKVFTLARRIISGTALASALVVGVAFTLANRFSGTAQTVATQIERVGRGQLDQRIAPFGIVEADVVADAFNSMAARLETTRAELVRSEAWFRSLVVSGSDVLWVLDDSGAVRFVSPSATRILGFPADQATGARFVDLLPLADRARMQHAIGGARTGARSVEHGFVGAPDTSIYESRVSDFWDIPGEQGVVLSTRDISERKALESDVERALELDRLKSEFLGLASHELRTPLTGIYGFSELLQYSNDIPDLEKAWANHINAEAVRLRDIIDALLNVSRIESGPFAVDLEAVPLRETVDAALRSRVASPDGRHRLTIDIDTALVVVAHRQRLLEVVENLVGNAIKYSPDGGRITVRGFLDGDQVRLDVADEGLGIPSDAIPTLFDRFKRVDAPDRAQIRGTGLGLYIVKRYVESFQGAVEVESRLTKGSTFSVTMRRADALARAS